ncbi:hypothetical protein HFV01_21280 [Limnospira fusiformis SAG 85.79]|uniref:Uncharacterized protein n=1 Tax=Limnospira maxima CS-328 TaxID=513049 RepID=B5W4E0_LIMMA|nr:hypothetical protein AmaxDRAFT_3656 [Limnospira maxima CS-328]QJB27847.1 hypothetical protein HFV01_21280 [Limnospira fusiformis SAG 85.79]
MVEREVTFPNSNSKPCLRVSQHTAPDVDTLFVSRNRATTPRFVTSTLGAIYNVVVFKLALVIKLLIVAVSISTPWLVGIS